ncbi:hypothetical protein SAY86_006849 [Trapa natans]|uniref:PORR domain-containing protein n=1 Tax=Trapa natans TaxID=22666 RepID=A0AAN7L568_TRANT|nr:hypothetical protein SAY86_006849 [Trapa natans]
MYSGSLIVNILNRIAIHDPVSNELKPAIDSDDKLHPASQRLVHTRISDLKAVNLLISIISHAPNSCLPIYHLSRCRGQLGLPEDLKISTVIRRYPNIFSEYHALDSGGTPVPWLELTSRAIRLHEEELAIFYSYHLDILSRLQKLLMLTRDRVLPLQTLDQLKWDLGLPYNYEESLIRKSLDIFSLICLPD